MRETTLWDRIKDAIMEPYYSLEYFFAKKWLDRNFGKEEYWGDKLSVALSTNKESK